MTTLSTKLKTNSNAESTNKLVIKRVSIIELISNKMPLEADYKCSKCTHRVFCNRCNSLKIKKNSFDTHIENRNLNKKASLFKLQSSSISKSTPLSKVSNNFLSEENKSKTKMIKFSSANSNKIKNQDSCKELDLPPLVTLSNLCSLEKNSSKKRFISLTDRESNSNTIFNKENFFHSKKMINSSRESIHPLQKSYKKSTFSRETYRKCVENKSLIPHKKRNIYKNFYFDMSPNFNKPNFNTPLKKIKLNIRESKVILADTRKNFMKIIDEFYSTIDSYVLTD
jgi:hypothetical protein